MKLVRADLMAEGRSDIATKVRAYRGGYSQEVRISTSSIMSISQLKHHHRIVARSSRKRFRAAYLVSWLQMRSSWVLISVHVCSLIVLFFISVCLTAHSTQWTRSYHWASPSALPALCVLLSLAWVAQELTRTLQRQQSGRAGRRSRDSLSVLVSDSLPVDRHFVANPEEIFDKVNTQS